MALYLHPAVGLHGMVLVKHRDNFTFYRTQIFEPTLLCNLFYLRVLMWHHLSE